MLFRHLEAARPQRSSYCRASGSGITLIAILLVGLLPNSSQAQEIGVLYKQDGERSGNFVFPDNWGTANDGGFNGSAAEDFVVAPIGNGSGKNLTVAPTETIPGWLVTALELDADWAFQEDQGNPLTANVYIHVDDDGHPGGVIAQRDLVPVVRTTNPFRIEFSDAQGGITIPEGTHWFSIEFVTTVPHDVVLFTSGDEFGNPVHYRNPGDRFGTGCTEFTPLPECGLDNYSFDFQLEGYETEIGTSRDIDRATAADKIEDIRMMSCPMYENVSWSFLTQQPLDAGDHVASNGEVPFDIELTESSWLGMVQCTPDPLWAQPTFTVLIPAVQTSEDVEAQTIRNDWPITVNGVRMWSNYGTRENSADRLDSNPSAIIEIQDGPTLSVEAEGRARPRECAVLVITDPDPEQEAEDRESFEQDLATFRSELMNERLGPRLTDDQIIELRYSTREEILAAISGLKGSCDKLWIYWMGHGHKAGLTIKNEEDPLGWTTLAETIIQTDIPDIDIVFGSCHSGASFKYFDRIVARGKYAATTVTVVAAANEDKKAYAQPRDFDGMMKWSGSFTYWFSKGFGNPEADADGDSTTTLNEAFRWLRQKNPTIRDGSLFFLPKMNDASDPVIHEHQGRTTNDKNISFEDADLEVTQTVSLDPGATLVVKMASGLSGSEADPSGVSEVSPGRHWVVDGVDQTGPFEMDLAFRYDPVLDFAVDGSSIPGLATRPIQAASTGKASADLWQEYTPTFWNEKFNTITATNVTEFMEWAIAFTSSAVVSIENLGGVPNEFRFDPVYPNPSSHTVVISYHLPSQTYVSVRAYDAAGRLVETLLERPQTTGQYRLRWDPWHLGAGAGPSNGTYLIRIDTPKRTQSQLVVLVR